MASEIDNLILRAQEVQKETGAGRNSANRIGGLLCDMIKELSQKPEDTGIKTVKISELDSIKAIGSTNVYRVQNEDESYCGILLVAEDVSMRSVSQLLVADIVPTESNFGATRAPGTVFLLSRGYSGNLWTPWRYQGLRDDLTRSDCWWSSKHIDDLLKMRYKTAKFAGTVDDEIMGSSTAGTGNAGNVYFSTHLMCFVLKKDNGYFSRWDNSSIWNDKYDTNSPIAYSDCFYINSQTIYVFNGENLESLSGSEGSVVSPDLWDTVRFAAVLDGTEDVINRGISDELSAADVFYSPKNGGFVGRKMENLVVKYYGIWGNSARWNEGGGAKPRTQVYFVASDGSQWTYNKTFQPTGEIEGVSMTIDNVLDEESENPVQNKVITNALKNMFSWHDVQ